LCAKVGTLNSIADFFDPTFGPGPLGLCEAVREMDDAGKSNGGGRVLDRNQNEGIKSILDFADIAHRFVIFA
jgi:hypothetical protein